MKENSLVLVGHPFAPIGRGEDVRCIFRSLKKVGVAVSIYDIYSFYKPDEGMKREFFSYLTSELGSVNIFIINGDEVKPVMKHLREKIKKDSYNIIYPQWELGIYPQEWADALNLFDEIWAPSRFVFESISKKVAKPVFHMPLPTEVKISYFLGRRYFGIPEFPYIFLFFFDMRSYIQRKNPFGLIAAFEKLCSIRPNKDFRLVIKLSRGEEAKKRSDDLQRFISLIETSRWKDRIIIIDKVLTDNEIKNLVRCADCFVSLHRSEGYGRGLAEAMFLSKPVIATGYSGNLDFMNDENSILIGYKLIDVGEGDYPHSNGQVWAEPNIEEAAEWMAKLVDDPEFGRKLGEKASRHIRTHFGLRASGLRYMERLRRIFEEKMNA
jgi:glycosyltransferase involved in cell wall biosynthesis